jgi:hypothetical protein
METFILSEPWKILNEHLTRELDALEGQILGGRLKTVEEYKEACGKRNGILRVLRLPQEIRNVAGRSLSHN